MSRFTDNYVDRVFKSVCKDKKIILVVDGTCSKNFGSAQSNLNKVTIASKFTNNRIKLAIFFHEVGHVLNDRKKIARSKRNNNATWRLSTFEDEVQAWTIGMRLYDKYVDRAFTKEQCHFMLKCLTSYSNDDQMCKRQKNL